MINFSRIQKKAIKIWSDPVWSKVISAGIIVLVGSIWAKATNYNFSDLYCLIINVLSFKVPLYIFFSLTGGYYVLKILLKFTTLKQNTVWDEIIGDYKFRELVSFLSKIYLKERTYVMANAGFGSPSESLLELFNFKFSSFSTGVLSSGNYSDGGFMFKILAPKLRDFGLVDRSEFYNVRASVNDVEFKTTDARRKFFALLQKTGTVKTHLC